MAKKHNKNDSDNEDDEQTKLEDDDLEEDDEEKLEESIKDAIDRLEDKRSHIRSEALTILRKLLKNNYAVTVFENYVTTTMKALTTCVSKASTDDEVLNSLAVLHLLAFSIADDALSLVSMDQVNNLCQFLETRITVEQVSKRRVALVQCLCSWYFVRESEPELIRKDTGILDTICKRYWHDADPLIIAASIQGSALLSTLIMPQYRISQILKKHRQELIGFLTHPNLEVRLAAGEYLCILYEAYHAVHEDLDLDEQVEKEQLDKVVLLVKDCIGENSKNVSKKDKSKQKTSFREWVKTIESGQAPLAKITFKKQTIELSDWCSIVQVSWVRDIFGAGLVNHFELNDIIRAILNIQDEPVDIPAHKLSAHEKKKLLSKNSVASKRATIEKHKITRQFAEELQNE